MRHSLILGLLLLLAAGPQVARSQYKVHKVVIDAGHGGKDPGAIGSKSREKDIAPGDRIENRGIHQQVPSRGGSGLYPAKRCIRGIAPQGENRQ